MNDQAKSTPMENAGGLVGRQHHRLHFNELSETFLARIIAAKCPDLGSRESVHVRFS